jgi:Holliday junction resolvase RusA-like endonuclease
MFESNKRLPAWRDAITMACSVYRLEHSPAVLLGPLSASLVFYLERPRSVIRTYPNTAPDIDKLIRGCFDGIQESGLISNDAQFVSVTAIKFYADDKNPPGVDINIAKKM